MRARADDPETIQRDFRLRVRRRAKAYSHNARAREETSTRYRLRDPHLSIGPGSTRVDAGGPGAHRGADAWRAAGPGHSISLRSRAGPPRGRGAEDPGWRR